MKKYTPRRWRGSGGMPILKNGGGYHTKVLEDSSRNIRQYQLSYKHNERAKRIIQSRDPTRRWFGLRPSGLHQQAHQRCARLRLGRFPEFQSGDGPLDEHPNDPGVSAGPTQV